MADAGILTENDRVELIDGEIVKKMTIGPRHNACVDAATRAVVVAAGDRAIVRVQGSIGLSFLTEPEPDLVLLRARDDFYAKALPTPADVLLIVEVADASLSFDRNRKRPLYAEAGVAEFWLVDLTTNSVFRHCLRAAQRTSRSIATRAATSSVRACCPIAEFRSISC